MINGSTKRIDERCIRAIQDIQKRAVLEKKIYIGFCEASIVLGELYNHPDRPILSWEVLPSIKRHYKKNKMNNVSMI